MFVSMIQKRRSIRKFSETKIETDKMDILVESALRAPSSMGRNPWEFVFVTERDKLTRLSRAKPHGSSFLQNAALGIVVCADSEKSDVWIEDASIAAIFLQLAAESMGLSSCWIQIRERMHDQTRTAESYVSQTLNIPERLKILCIVAMGYADEEKAPHRKEELLYEKVHLDGHGNSYGK